MTVRDLAPQDAAAALKADSTVRILDVRTQPEFDAYHLAGAELLPIQELEGKFDSLDSEAQWMIFCEHGVRSVAACQFLEHHGFSNLTNVTGGMARWIGENISLDPRGDA